MALFHTIGHSTRPLGELIDILDSQHIRLLVDVDARKMACEERVTGIKVERGKNRCDRTGTAAKANHKIIHFFEVYKELEDKDVEVDGWQSASKAHELIMRYQVT